MSASRNTKLTHDEERPLTARSVLASALLGEEPPRLPVAQLVRIAAAFDINENRARVALSRMAANAEVQPSDGVYELISKPLLARQQRQRLSRVGATKTWKGDWLIAIVGPQPAAAEQRAQRRVDLNRARFSEYRDGVWVRPNNLAHIGLVRSDVYITVGSSGSPDFDQPDELSFVSAVPRLWDVAAWATRAQRLLTRLEQVDPVQPENLANGFVLSAACLRHFQLDPLLPSALLPADWPGSELRNSYNAWDRRYRRLLASTQTNA
jgi:phenylacetic acid degradation operon negative regulatory protein